MQAIETAPNLRTEIAGPVLRVTIAREAKHNALSRAAIDEIGETFARHAENGDILLAVLRGEGDKSFAAGGDLKDLDSVRTREQAAEMSSTTRNAFDAIRRFPVPVVAALNGNAVGGGAELASACDLRVAASHAKIGFIQGRLGITTAWGGGIDLCAIVGYQKALWLTLSGQTLDGPEALGIGLYDALAEPGESVNDAVDRMIAPLLKQPRIVLSSFKTLNRKARVSSDRAALDALETELFSHAWIGDAHWAAVDAFNSRRKP